MDDLQATKRTVSRHLWLNLFLENLVFGLCLYVTISYLNTKLYIDFAISAAVGLLFITLITTSLSNFIIQPLYFLRQAILHLSPSGNVPVKVPDLRTLTIGQELTTNLVGQLYEIARGGHESAVKDGTIGKLNADFIANSLPLPLFVLDDKEDIKFANKAAASYLGKDVHDLNGKNIYTMLDMSFPTEDTFDNWLKGVKQKTAISAKSWERVRLNVSGDHPMLLFDLAAYYNQGNVDGNSTLLVLFDHTNQYSQEDQTIGFIALSVHELRTPLTLLRGYIEVFEQELRGKVSPELEDFLDKLHVASEQLTAFVNNILNVARIDNDQLQLRLLPEDWGQILVKAIDAVRLKAKVRGINIELNISPDIPKVGVDRLSIQEVVNNLIDNAVKYSGNSNIIKITCQVNADGLVETDVEDFGVGIEANIIQNLFTKFYRDHRNRSQVGGTGLGLYLAKAIVTAHGGNIWVRSTVGKGTTFGFTLVPYDQLSKERKAKDDGEIITSAHGWIKNHSYYKR